MPERETHVEGPWTARDDTERTGGQSPGNSDELIEGGALADVSCQGAAPVRPSRRRVHRKTLLWGGAAAVLLAGTIAAAWVPAAPPASTQAAQTITTAQDSPAPVPAKPTASAKPTGTEAPLRLIYRGAGVDIPVLALTPTAAQFAAGEVEPPETQDTYWLTNYGRPGIGSADTTFLISHRWIGQDTPFNRIGNNAKPGDRFSISTQTETLDFTVSTVKTFDKAKLNTAPIWNAVPGRVVMITCDEHDPWAKNTVITADPTSYIP